VTGGDGDVTGMGRVCDGDVTGRGEAHVSDKTHAGRWLAIRTARVSHGCSLCPRARNVDELPAMLIDAAFLRA
jgi:hypothetical protein